MHFDFPLSIFNLIMKGAIMKVLSKMDNDVTYTIGKENYLLLKKQECELDKRVAEHPVFKIHLANGGVEILDSVTKVIIEDKELTEMPKDAECEITPEDSEKYRQELIQKCKDKGIKVNPNTGIKKLKEKLGE